MGKMLGKYDEGDEEKTKRIKEYLDNIIKHQERILGA